MRPRERWQALLRGERADRVPTDYGAAEEVTGRLCRELDCATEPELWRRLDIDKLLDVAPPWRPRRPPVDPAADAWGLRLRKVSVAGGAYLHPERHPLAEATSASDVHAHAWPDPDDFDYDAVGRALESNGGFYPTRGGKYEPFLLYGRLRGVERALVDLALRPKIADAILGRLFDFHVEQVRRILEAAAGRIDLVVVAEDLGSQSGPLLSLATYRRFLLPNQQRMADLARRHGAQVFYHGDGALRPFLGDLVDVVGIDVLDPVQWRCPGMEREQLVAGFGERLVFHGSIDNQQTLARGRIEDVEREVRESLEIYRDARWICAPCHRIQPGTPTENVLALYRTLQEQEP